MADKLVFNTHDILERVDSDMEFLAELVEIFLEKTPDDLKEIDESIKKENRSKLETQIHTLKGTCANMGCEIMADTALQLQLMISDSPFEKIREKKIKLNLDFENVKKVIYKLL